MASLETILKKIYKEGLEPYGFVKLKGRYPYFVRVIGDEIIQVITFEKVKGYTTIENVYRPDLKEFMVLGGIATVYRRKIDLAVPTISNGNWMNTQSLMYVISKKYKVECMDKELLNDICSYIYKPDDEQSMYEAGIKSLEMTKKIMLPIFDGVEDIKTCISYLEKYQRTYMNLYDEEKYGWTDDKFGFDYHNEALLYIKTKCTDDYIELYEEDKRREYDLIMSGKTGLTMEHYKKYCVESEERRLKKIEIRDRILNTPEIYNNAMLELNRRKKVNQETLRSYGLNI